MTGDARYRALPNGDSRSLGLPPQQAQEPHQHSGAAGLLRPLLDVWPVPRWPSADGPRRVGEQLPVAPHGDGLALDAEAVGDVVSTDRIAVLRGHEPIMNCRTRIDKCRARVYNRDMTTSIAAPIENTSGTRVTHVTYEGRRVDNAGTVVAKCGHWGHKTADAAIRCIDAIWKASSQCQKVGCKRTDTTHTVVNEWGGYKLLCPDHAQGYNPRRPQGSICG